MIKNKTDSVPLVSVVMSVYNGRPYLDKAVESILSQTFRDFEFIIIDDGSTDGSIEDLKRYAACDSRIRLVIQENRGLTKSLNTGLKLACGKYIARMDADDIAFPERFEKQVAALDENPNLVMLGANVELITEYGIRLGLRPQGKGHGDIRRRLLLGDGSAMTHPVVMYHRQAALDIGSYDERFSTGQDLDLFLRLSEVGLVENLPETLLDWRQHMESINRTQFSTWRAMKILALEKTLERIGIKQFAEDIFGAENEFWFPKGCLELGQFALKNERYREASHFFQRELKNGPRKRDAFKQLSKVAIFAFWNKLILLRRWLSYTDSRYSKCNSLFENYPYMNKKK